MGKYRVRVSVRNRARAREYSSPFLFLFTFFKIVTAPQVERDWSAGDNCIPSAKYRV